MLDTKPYLPDAPYISKNNIVKEKDIEQFNALLKNYINFNDISDIQYKDDIDWLVAESFIVNEIEYTKERFNLASLFHNEILNLILLDMFYHIFVLLFHY